MYNELQGDLIIFERYKQNLSANHLSVFSYRTRVAQIDHINKQILPLKFYSKTTLKHINYVAKKYGYEVNNNIINTTNLMRSANNG